MKTHFKKYLILVLFAGLCFSCDDNEFLHETNPNEISKDTFWQDLNDTEQGLNAVYKTLHSPFIVNIIEEMQRSDMGYPGYGRPVPQNTEPFYNQTYTASSDEIEEKWYSNYQGIFRANQVITALENIKDTSGDVQEWRSQMAQARFFRALFHFYVYTTFNNGSIVIRDGVAVSEDDYQKPLSSKEDVIAFVRADLEYAYENLYKKGEYPDGDLSRVTSGAAATILGQTYLYELDYANAMPLFEDVINNHGYALEYDPTKWFTTAGEFNDESILEINFTEDFIRIDLSRWDGSSGTNWLNQQTSGTRGATGPAWAVAAYKSEPMDPLDDRNFYTRENGGRALRNVPLRSSAMMAVVEDNQTDYYLEPTSEFGRFHGKGWGFGWWKKYTNHDIVAAENLLPPYNSATLSSKNVVLNRLADVMLMQAECKIKTGDVDGALTLINEIRKRWGLVLYGTGGDASRTYDGVTYTPESLMHQLMYVDKPLEMGAEGHAIRWLDFIRWKKSDNYGFEERLQELSNMTFYGTGYTYVNSEGESVNRQNYPRLVEEDPGGDRFVVDKEYDIAVLNYSDATRAYYPIPLSERDLNSN